MNRPRLLIVTSTYPARADDGIPAFVRDLAREEAAAFDVMVLAPRVPGGAPRETDGALEVRRYPYFPKRWESLADGAIIENLRAKRSSWLQVLPFLFFQHRAMRKAVKNFAPDIAHVHWIIPQGLVARGALGSLPRLLTTLGGDLYALNAGPLRRLKSAVVRQADAVTVMNAEMRDIVIGLGADPERALVVPMGADVPGIKAGMAAAAGVATRDGAPGAAVRLLFVGRLVEKKGLTVLLDALAQLPAELTAQLALTVVGDGPLREGLAAQASGIAVPVEFVGQLGRAELSAQYAAADVVVTPSVLAASGDKDGLPVAMLEAMAAGRAIVASDVPGINEAIIDEESGLLVPQGDAAALAAAIARVASDDALRTRLGSAAERAADALSVASIGARYVEVLRGILARR